MHEFSNGGDALNPALAEFFDTRIDQIEIRIGGRETIAVIDSQLLQPRCGLLGMTGDDWGWLGDGVDCGDGSSVTEITYWKFIN